MNLREHFGRAELAVVLTTFGLFLIALFVRGITHDILLEAAVFLVSVKLIMMHYKQHVVVQSVSERLEDIWRLLEQREQSSGSKEA
jgi:hypothetical protein